MINYEKSLAIAKKLNLDANHATLFTNLFSTVTTPLLNTNLQKNLLQGAMKTGLGVLQGVKGTG